MQTTQFKVEGETMRIVPSYVNQFFDYLRLGERSTEAMQPVLDLLHSSMKFWFEDITVLNGAILLSTGDIALPSRIVSIEHSTLQQTMDVDYITTSKCITLVVHELDKVVVYGVNCCALSTERNDWIVLPIAAVISIGDASTLLDYVYFNGTLASELDIAKFSEGLDYHCSIAFSFIHHSMRTKVKKIVSAESLIKINDRRADRGQSLLFEYYTLEQNETTKNFDT